MPLTWDIEDIEDYKNVCWIREEEDLGDESKVRLNPVTEVLIWATISVSMGEITAKNADEFFARVFICDRLFGGFLIKDGKPENLTPEHIRAHIGLRTNVSEETRAKWMKRIVGDEMKAAAARYREAEKRANTEVDGMVQVSEQELRDAEARADAHFEQAVLAGEVVDADQQPEVTPKPNPFIGD